MARVNIEIDLRNSKLHDGDFEVPVEVVYHWNRIFLTLAAIAGLIAMAYYALTPANASDDKQTAAIQVDSENIDVTIVPDLMAATPETAAQPLSEANNITITPDLLKAQPEVAAQPLTDTDPVTVQPDLLKAKPEVAAQPLTDTDPVTVQPDLLKAKPEVAAQPLTDTDLVTVQPDLLKAKPEVAAQPLTDTDPVTVQPDLLNAKPAIAAQPLTETDPITITHVTQQSGVQIKILHPSMSRALLTNDIVDKEPVDTIQQVVTFNDKSASKKIFFFTQSDNMKGHVVRHQWWHKGKLVVDRGSKILGKRWRFYTSKHLNYKMEGEWQIKAIDENGTILAEATFFFDHQ